MGLTEALFEESGTIGDRDAARVVGPGSALQRPAQRTTATKSYVAGFSMREIADMEAGK